jgi:hypothetical protein
VSGWGAPQGADRRQLLVPVRSRDYPWGQVVARDPHTGQLVRCPCGAERWTAFGQAAHHGDACAGALVERARLEERHGRTRAASRLRHQALLAAVHAGGRRGLTARELAGMLGYTAGHVRELLRAGEAQAQVERRGRRPYRWRRRRGAP